VYEDAVARQWAGEVFERVAQLVGKDALRSTWWKMSDLNQPAVLAGAVSTAMRADVIVVAIHAAEGFPLPFYVWVDSWLPHHRQKPAALVALIGMPERPNLQLDGARDYLRAVARQGQLDFLSEDRKLGGAPAVATPQVPALKRSARRLSSNEPTSGFSQSSRRPRLVKRRTSAVAVAH
jgi:hypothetical protein